MRKGLSIIMGLLVIFFAGCDLWDTPTEITGGSGGTAEAGATTTFTLEASVTATAMKDFHAVQLNSIEFAYIEDLKVDIVTPAGTRFKLIDCAEIRHLDGSYYVNGGPYMLNNATIDTALQADGFEKPFNTIIETGFQAAESFASASGENPNGTWTLEISNAHDYRDCLIEGFSIYYTPVEAE